MAEYDYLKYFLKDLVKELWKVLPLWAKTKKKDLSDIKRYMNDFMDRKEAELKQKGFVSFQTSTDKSNENKIIGQIVKDFSRWGDYIDQQIRYEIKKGYKEELSQFNLENRLRRKLEDGARYAQTWVNTGEGAVNRAVILNEELENGTDYFEYAGPEGTDRFFCKIHLGKIYSLEKIQRLDNGQGLPVLYYCGGYNCRHRWVAVDDIELSQNDRKNIMMDKRFEKADQQTNSYRQALIFGYTLREPNLSDSIHIQLNKMLISNSRAKTMESYERQLSNSLKQVPKYEGTVYRGVDIDRDVVLSKYKAGLIISEPMFVSASKNINKKYEGNVTFKIISKNARDIEKLSAKPSDEEVLFDSHTPFKVLQVKEKNNKFFIMLKEK